MRGDAGRSGRREKADTSWRCCTYAACQVAGGLGNHVGHTHPPLCTSLVRPLPAEVDSLILPAYLSILPVNPGLWGRGRKEEERSWHVPQEASSRCKAGVGAVGALPTAVLHPFWRCSHSLHGGVRAGQSLRTLGHSPSWDMFLLGLTE